MNANVSGIMKQLVPAFLTAKPTASSRIARMPASCSRSRMLARYRLRFGMRHVDVDLIAREGGPEQNLVPTRGLVCSEGKTRPWGVQREQIRLARTVGKHAPIGQKHAG